MYSTECNDRLIHRPIAFWFNYKPFTVAVGSQLSSISFKPELTPADVDLVSQRKTNSAISKNEKMFEP